MKTNRKLFKLSRRFVIASLALIAGYVSTGSTMAASGGSLGSTSFGLSDIVIAKEDAIASTNIDDIFLGNSGSLSETTTASDDICIFTSTGAYDITFFSLNGSFTLIDGNTTTDIPYSVDWTTQSSNETAVYNTAITDLIGDSSSIDCNSSANSTNATISISISAPSFNAAEPGDYFDVLTLQLKAV